MKRFPYLTETRRRELAAELYARFGHGTEVERAAIKKWIYKFFGVTE